MISLTRIFAITWRHLLPTFRDPMRIADMIYWPFVDIVLMGFLVTWTQQDMVREHNFIITLLTCLICWYLIQRSCLEITKNLLIEIWEHHIINLFASPVTLAEIFIAFIIIGIINALATFVYSIAIVWLIFSQNIFAILGSLAPFIPLFIMSGWIIGFFIAALIFYFGKSVEVIVWAFPWLFAIISGAYYPLKLFPPLLQKIAYCFPTTYLFEGVRTMLLTGTPSSYYVGMGLALSIVYLALSYAFLCWMFKKSKDKGLTRLV